MRSRLFAVNFFTFSRLTRLRGKYIVIQKGNFVLQIYPIPENSVITGTGRLFIFEKV